MPSDDELRRVAEDVRALARSLGRDVRIAMDRFRQELYGPGQSGPAIDGDGEGSGGDGCGGGEPTRRRSARDDLAAAGRAARQELRQAQLALRQATRRNAGRFYPLSEGDDDEGEDHAERRARPWGAGYGPYRGGPRHRRTPPSHRRRRAWGPGGVLGGDGLEGSPPGQLSGLIDPVPTPTPPPPLRHRHDGSTLAGLLAVVFGLAWLAKGTHIAHISGEAVLAVALMVLGATMVITARTDWALSRRGWPVVGGAALGVVLAAFAVSPSFGGGFRHLQIGTKELAPVTWDGVPTVVHGGVGNLQFDLHNLSLPMPAPRTVAIDNAAGSVTVFVPSGLAVQVHATNVAGRIAVGGIEVRGVGRTLDQHIGPADSTGQNTLTLDITAGLGEVNVTAVDANSFSDNNAAKPTAVVPPPAKPTPPQGPTFG